MLNSTTLRFGWSSDLSDGLDAVSTFLRALELFTIPVHFWVITTLAIKACAITRDIRISYVADQLTMMLYGLTMDVLIEPYPIYPWPGYYCAGYLCDSLDEQIISLLFMATIISVIPFFCYILIRLHNQVVAGSGTKFVISPRNQVYVMSAIGSLMFGSLSLFGKFAVSAENSEQLKQVSNNMECHLSAIAFLLFGGCMILPLLLALTAHSLVIIRNRVKSFHLSEKTQRAQDRLATAFFLQMIAAAIFFAIPTLIFMYLMLVDTSSWPERMLSIIRPILILSLSLKPPVQSLIYLSKNPVLRKKAIDEMRSWFCRGDRNKLEQTPVGMISKKHSSSDARQAVEQTATAAKIRTVSIA